MKPVVKSRDAEYLVKEYLKAAMVDQDCTVSIGVPENWTPSSIAHVEVVSDGEPLQAWPVVMYATIRIVVRSASTTEAKALCGLAFGLLLAHNGDGVIVGTRPLTGVLAARDPDTKAELASATVRVTVRTEPIESGS